MQRLVAWTYLGALALLVGCSRPESPAVTVVGTWQARANDLAAVTLVVKNDNGQLGGRIVFHFQQKAGDVWHITRENIEPLVEPRFAGEVLSFRVSHEKAHPGESGPADPPVDYEMRLTGPDEGMLRSTNYGVDTETKMTRVK